MLRALLEMHTFTVLAVFLLYTNSKTNNESFKVPSKPPHQKNCLPATIKWRNKPSTDFISDLRQHWLHACFCTAPAQAVSPTELQNRHGTPQKPEGRASPAGICKQEMTTAPLWGSEILE